MVLNVPRMESGSDWAMQVINLVLRIGGRVCRKLSFLNYAFSENEIRLGSLAPGMDAPDILEILLVISR